MAVSIKKLIRKKNCEGLRDVLLKDPKLANEGIPLSRLHPKKAHPLHRICDGVFEKIYTDEEATEMARIFLEHGANVNGFPMIERQDTPLIAATSLHADRVAILLIENGANIHHAGTHGGTALHWAAWCGRDTVVDRLVREGADINKRCLDFQATPLFWAVHGFKNGGKTKAHKQLECAEILLQAGADTRIPNGEGTEAIDLLDKEDRDWRGISIYWR